MKKAFTMAEVLITIGIIGLVAAMTLPTVINNTRNKELDTALKKAYTVMQQAMLRIMLKDGVVDPALFEARQFNSYFIEYFNQAIDCGFGFTNNPFSNDICSQTVNYKNYTNTASVTHQYLDDGRFILPDGMAVFIQNEKGGGVRPQLLISVDVNGVKKRPNQWGHDLFTFELKEDGRLLPMGQEGTTFYDTECSPTSSSGLNGIGCTAKALSEPDYWNNLP